MSEHLDDDYKKWPKDAFELLQVAPGSDKKTIRRAYNSLIKKYKPDHFPEEFRIIREAYETALNQLEYQDFFTVFNEPVEEEESRVSLNVEPIENPEEKYWSQALKGEIEEAFTGLRNLVEQTYESEVVLKLFWLKKVNPELPEIDFLPILTKSYLKSFNYRTSTLIYKEMEQNVYWSLSGECLNFIELLSRENSETTRQLLDKRWLLAYQGNKLEIIPEDLEKLRHCYALNEVEWGLILLASQNFLSFWEGENAQEMVDKYSSEIAQIPINAGGYLDSAMDSFDFLKEIREIINKDEHKFIDDVWRKIISSYWAGSSKTSKDILELKILSWVKKPEEALLLFDGLDSKYKPMAVSQVKKIVNSYAYQLNSDIYGTVDEHVNFRIKEFLNSKVFNGYFSDREAILLFSVYQDVPPDEIVSYVMENELESLYWIQNISKDIHESVYLAYKALMYV